MNRTLLFLAFALMGGRAVGQNLPVPVASGDSLSAAKQVDSLNQISRALTAKRDFEKALEANIAAKKIALEKLGRETAAYGNACYHHGLTFHFMGNYDEAEKWYLEARGVLEKAVGKGHPDYAWSLNNLAALYAEQSIRNDKSEPLYLEAKAIMEKALGREHPDCSRILLHLAMFHMWRADFELAEPLFHEARAIQEKSQGKANLGYAKTLHHMATLYSHMGNYEKGELLYLEEAAIREKVQGRESDDYALSRNNLAILYKKWGNYEKAERFFHEAKAIWEKNLGKKHRLYSASLTNLGGLYDLMGNREKALPCFLEALDISAIDPGKETSFHAGHMGNLGFLYFKMGNVEKGEPLMLESKAIFERAVGKEHPQYALCLTDLGTAYSLAGSYLKAEPFFLEEKAVREKVQGREHPDYAKCLNSLAVLYANLGDHPKAELFFREAQTVQEKMLGKAHPDYAENLNGLAELYAKMGLYEKAEPLFEEFSKLNQSLIARASNHLSERELNNYQNTFSANQDQILSFAQLAGSNGAVRTCFDNSLFFKGFLLNTANQTRRLALTDTTATEVFSQLKSCQRRLAVEYAKPIAGRKNVAGLEERANELAKDLARAVAGYGEAMRQVAWQEVRSALKAGEVAVEFVRYRFWRQKQTDSSMYAALVLLPDAIGPQFVPLFEERQLDSLMSRGTGGGDIAARANGLYASRGASPVYPKNGQSKSIYDLVWAPVEKQLAGIKTVYFSPSGQLFKLNHGAIPAGGDMMLADRYILVELGSTRQLVVPSDAKTKNNDALLFGGIQYDMDSMAI